MNAAAKAVMTEMPEITIAYGISDEYRYETKGLLSHSRQLTAIQLCLS